MVINHLCLLRNSKDSLLFDFKKYTLKGEGKFYFDRSLIWRTRVMSSDALVQSGFS